MDKKTTLLVTSGAIVALAIMAYFAMKSPPVPSDTPADLSETSAYGTGNPLEAKPDLNPVEKANPFADIKTNPFE